MVTQRMRDIHMFRKVARKFYFEAKYNKLLLELVSYYSLPWELL
jgi:hypothetical protein